MSRIDRGGGASSPPYPFRHSGPCVVAGNALCLNDDLVKARVLFPDAQVVAVNGAAREVRALALFSYHPERMVLYGYDWIRHQRRINDKFTVHGSKFVEDCPWVQYWWEDARGGGSSAWGARKLAWLMGFDPVILCGCPLEPGPYAGYRPGMAMTKMEVIEPYRLEIRSDTDWHDGCFSMSGWTKEFFGEPC